MNLIVKFYLSSEVYLDFSEAFFYRWKTLKQGFAEFLSAKSLK